MVKETSRYKRKQNITNLSVITRSGSLSQKKDIDMTVHVFWDVGYHVTQ
jgi:hypothetical protein